MFLEQFHPLQVRRIYFQVGKNLLFNHLYELHQNLEREEINIRGDGLEFKRWSSNIQLSRVKKDRKWFDLSIDISASDLEIIKHLGTGENISSVGDTHFIISEEQKLLKLRLKTIFQSPHQQKKKKEKRQNFIVPFNRARIFELVELKKLGIDNLLTEEEEALLQPINRPKGNPSI